MKDLVLWMNEDCGVSMEEIDKMDEEEQKKWIKRYEDSLQSICAK